MAVTAPPAWRSRRLFRWGALVVACLLAGLAAAVAALPSLVRWGLENRLEKATGMRASVGSVEVRRRTGEVRIGELRVTHPRSGKLVAGWNGVTGRIRYAPLLLGTVRFQTMSLDGPHLSLARAEDRPEGDAIPLSAFAAGSARGPLTPSVDLQSLEILRGRINFFDAAGQGRSVRVEDLMVRVSDLGTGRGAAGRRTNVAMSARWEGGQLEVNGWVKPFAEPPEGDLSLRVVDLDLSLVDALLFAARGSGLGGADRPGLLALPLTIRSGRADATARLTRGPTGPAAAEVTLAVRQLGLDLAEGRGHASARSVRAAVPVFDPGTWTLRDGRIEVEGVEGDVGALGGLAGRIASLQVALGGVDLRQRSLQSARLDVAGVAVARAADGLGLDAGRVRLTAESAELASRLARGIGVEAEGLALRGAGWPGAAGRIGSVRAAADALDLGARSGRKLSIQAEGLAATGLGQRSLSAELRSLKAAAETVTAGGQGLEGVSASLEGAVASGGQGPLGSLEVLRVAVQGADLRARTVRGASVSVERLAASRAGEAEPFAVVRAARAEVPRLDVAGLLSSAPAALEVAQVEVEAPALRVRRDAAGIDLARFLPGAGGLGPPAPAAASSAGPGPSARAGAAISPAAVAVGFGQIRGGSLVFTDATVTPEASLSLQDITVNLLNFRPGSGIPATLALSARAGEAGSIQLGAQFTPGTFRTANGTARLQDLDVDLARPYLKLPSGIARIAGRVSLDAEARPAASPGLPAGAAPMAPLDVGPAASANVRPEWKIVARAEARGLAGRNAAGKVLAELPALDLRDIDVTVPDLAVVVGEVAADRFTLPVERDAAGVVRVAGMSVRALGTRFQASGPPSLPAGLPPVRIRQVHVTGMVPLVDRARPYPLETAITDIALDLRDVGTVRDSAMGLQLSGRLEELRFAAAGTTRFGPLQGQAYLDLTSLDVVRWADYLPDGVRGRLADLRGEAHLEVAFGAALPDLVVRGRVEAAPLQLAEPDGDGVVGAEKATIAIDRLTLAPLALHAGAVALERPWIRFERRPDGRINLMGLLDLRAAQGPKGTPRAAAARQALSAFRIDQLTLQNGVVDVSDQTLSPPFRERLRQVTGKIANFSADETTQATFELEGRLGDGAPLVLRGRGVPRPDHPSLELDGHLGAFNLVGLSPYVRRLTSHRIQQGKIEIAVRYQLDARQLEGQNHIRIDQLGVGDPEEWPDKFTDLVGVSLPTAVSLLQDGDGVIELDVPVRGDVAHPEFDFDNAIHTAIKNAVVDAVTAPFRLIGKIFSAAGRIEEVQIDPILFEAGSAGLAQAGKQGVGRLVAFLNNAPRVRLQLVGYAEPEQDEKALQAASAAQGGGVLRRLVRRLGTGAPPTPDVNALARRRAVAVQNALTDAGIEPSRVFLAEPVVETAAAAQERGKPAQGRVEFRLLQ